MGEQRAFLSIGDVLSLLKDDFPDITISKIRFLESQGLLDPERTPSGYRKFYEEDVERLRWILRQQRENFLPLKVIKGRLEGVEPSIPAAAQLELGLNGEDRATKEMEVARLAAVTSPASSGRATEVPTGRGETNRGDRAQGDEDGLQIAREALGLSPPRSGGTPKEARSALGLKGPTSAGLPAAKPADLSTQSSPSLRHAQTPEADESGGDDAVSLSASELAAASDLPPEEIDDLVRFGLIRSRSVAGTQYFDGEALSVARLAAGFRRFGIEARHVRIYRLAAEREVGLFEQVILPVLKQRNPEARKQARQAVNELSRLGQQMRTAMVKSILRGLGTS